MAVVTAPAEAEHSYFSVAFETPGWKSHEDSVVIAVLQKLLGGGSSFSSGGPGKGASSALSLSVL